MITSSKMAASLVLTIGAKEHGQILAAVVVCGALEAGPELCCSPPLGNRSMQRFGSVALDRCCIVERVLGRRSDGCKVEELGTEGLVDDRFCQQRAQILERGDTDAEGIGDDLCPADTKPIVGVHRDSRRAERQSKQ